MKIFDLLHLYRREMKHQRKKMTLTILALAWGTLSVVVLLAFGDGFRIQMMTSSHGLGEGIVIIDGGQTSKPYQGLGKGRRIFLTEDDVELLRNRVAGIALISPESEQYANTMIYGRKTLTQRVTGVDPDFGELRTYYPVRGSRFLNLQDTWNRRRVVFLGSTLKEKLFGDKEAVGDTFLINGVPFLVVGVMQKKMQNSMYNGPDAEKAAIPFSTYKEIYGVRAIDRIIYKPADPARADVVKREIIRILARKYKFDLEDKQAIDVWDTLEEEKLMGKIFAGIQIFLGIVGGMTLLVAGVGVANIMYVSTKRRTREIGIKMALGAKKKYILSQLITEALGLSFTGGAAGIVVSLAMISAARIVPAQGEAAELLLHPVLSLDIMILTAFILSLIGFFAGFFPARRAAGLDPVEALRYE